MIYKAYLKQQGEGCDYTIGCAQTVIEIEAQNIDEAKQKLKIIYKPKKNAQALVLTLNHHYTKPMLCEVILLDG